MSAETLNLLSDSTFASKMDSEIAALNGIKNAMGGNLAGTIATIEISPAAVAHAVGEYIYYNSELYKVTATIAIGDTLTAGTNIVKTTVGSEISAVNSDKVDKINGKGLSTNDFTTAYKNKLDNVDTTVTENSSNLVTSGAVHTAVQGAGFQWVVPKPYDQASTRDDFYIGDSYSRMINQYTVVNNGIRIDSINEFYLWFKMSAFDLTEPFDIFDRFLFMWSGEYDGNPLKLHYPDTYNSKPGYFRMQIDRSSYDSSPLWNILRILKL